jgi:hypothetical protein
MKYSETAEGTTGRLIETLVAALVSAPEAGLEMAGLAAGNTAAAGCVNSVFAGVPAAPVWEVVLPAKGA